MDAANKLSGKSTPYLWEATEWADAYKATLSKNKQNDFDKEWQKLEKQLESFQTGEKGAVSPFKIQLLQ